MRAFIFFKCRQILLERPVKMLEIGNLWTSEFVGEKRVLSYNNFIVGPKEPWEMLEAQLLK